MSSKEKIETAEVTSEYNVYSIREDFPILNEQIRNKPLIYLDNAATTQKPNSVIEKINEYYNSMNSNVHRGVHYLSQKATVEYENAREKVMHFINAKNLSEIIFVKGATESINLVASSYGRHFLKKGDEIIISEMEHHSNLVPWQLLCEEKQLKLRVIPINDNGEIIFEEYVKLINEKTKFVSIVHISNSLGTINPIKDIIDYAHSYNIPVLIDGSQSIQHTKIDVKELDCDFFVFSGHKLYAPMGIGILYGKEELLEQMPPYQSGGDMISKVTIEKTTFNELPYKFEAGTPNVVGGIGLGTAIDYINSIGIDNINHYEKELLNYINEKLLPIPKLKPIGTAKNKSAVFSFIIDGIHPHDIGTVLDFEGIAIRTGHHCTQPVMQRFNIPATARISIGLYNTKEEIDVVEKAIKKVFEVFT